jgi:hypothetical protein
MARPDACWSLRIAARRAAKPRSLSFVEADTPIQRPTDLDLNETAGQAGNYKPREFTFARIWSQKRSINSWILETSPATFLPACDGSGLRVEFKFST